ncbi:DUF1345 domain-containing protein [Actinomyces slackii]|uniref:Predicted membrane protein n=1 Tax=Actinomyces slackii TaxID=52774 RepID=A0A448KA79_9ACTO|nr:DUF1345 domain-containing protein [Actinomyces slackii]VEG73829.1 Predicted membrane protein [Actinomyces slackii]
MHLSRSLAVVEILLLLAGVAQFLAPTLGLAAICVLSWIFLAAAYVIGSLEIARRQKADPTLRLSPSSVRGFPTWVRGLSDLTPILAAATGLLSAVSYLGPTASTEVGDSALRGLIDLFLALDDSEFLTIIIGTLGWFVLHVGYAHLYQRIDMLSRGRAFAFPATPQASSVEYLYLGMTLGATFGTSDVTVRSRRARWAVMSHTILAFLYNAVVIAVVVRLLTGN